MAAPKAPASETYGTCRLCGDAVPPGASKCPICGQEDPIRAGEETRLKGRAKRRFQVLKFGRTSLVAIVIVGLALLTIQAAITPAPVAANPLTETQVLSIAPGKFALIQGYITGADYIEGNFTVLDPPGANLTFSIFNSTEFPIFDENRSATPMVPSVTGSSERIVYSALYTDTYSFVWANHYPSGSNLTLTMYVTTTYETNVVVD